MPRSKLLRCSGFASQSFVLVFVKLFVAAALIVGLRIGMLNSDIVDGLVEYAEISVTLTLFIIVAVLL